VTTTLVVTEKPDAALHVAEALSDDHQPGKIYVNGVTFFEITNPNERIIVCSALGHLYAVAPTKTESRSHYPVWEYAWKPKHVVERGQGRQEKWIKAIEKVSKDALRFVDACDYDVEGSLIGYTILKYACHGADAQALRMKFSTLTGKELRAAYWNPLPHLDFELAFAGMCRHEVDWLYGINLSRALTQSAFKVSKRYTTLSTGRVQGPTLRFIVEREKEIQAFVPTPFWTLRTRVDVDGQIVDAEHEDGHIESQAIAERIVKECRGKIGVISKLDSSNYRLPPPTPLDLSTLQNEAYRHLGYAPRYALSIAERLYLDQLISYPRTSSQKLPPSIGYREIMNGLAKIGGYQQDVAGLMITGRVTPNEGRKEDPAHPAIYPTGSLPKRSLGLDEQRLFDLVVRRFLSTFGNAATRQTNKATVAVGQHKFYLRGSRTIESGWIPLYGPYAKFDDVTLPPMREGQTVKIESIRPETRHTQPPSRYNPSSLLKTMEDAEIGTKATRAEIIDTLYKRGYLKDQRIAATPLAFSIIEILSKYCPKVIDTTFTRELEEKMQHIELGEESKERIIKETIGALKPIIEDLKSKEQQIGEELNTIITDSWLASITLAVPCPKCGSSLKIVKNPRTRKRFIGCTGKWKSNCSFSLPLPQKGRLRLLNKRCPECAFQLIQVSSKGRRPLISCANCYARKRAIIAAMPSKSLV